MATFISTEEDGALRLKRGTVEDPEQANCAICIDSSTQYYEVHIDSLQPGSMLAVGFARETFPTTGSLPGWKSSSYGYHSDDGLKYSGTSMFSSLLGPAYGVRDIVGCGLRGDEVFWTLNGVEIGCHTRGQLTKNHNLVPCIGSDGLVSLFVTLECAIPAQIQGGALRHSTLMSLSNNSPLPHIVTVGILYYLVNTPIDYAHYGLVCKTFLKAAQTNIIWIPLIKKRFPQVPPVQMKSWFRFYRNRIRAEMAETEARKIRDNTAAILACDWEVECPLLYENLKKVDATKSFCDTCNEHVTYISSHDQLRTAVSQGMCVAYDARLLAQPEEVGSKYGIYASANFGVFGGNNMRTLQFILPFVSDVMPSNDMVDVDMYIDPFESYRKIVRYPNSDRMSAVEILGCSVTLEDLQGDYARLAPLYYQKLDAVILLFDEFDEDSFNLYHSCIQEGNRRSRFWVIVTKEDVPPQPGVGFDEEFRSFSLSDVPTVAEVNNIWHSISSGYEEWDSRRHRKMGKRAAPGCSIN